MHGARHTGQVSVPRASQARTHLAWKPWPHLGSVCIEARDRMDWRHTGHGTGAHDRAWRPHTGPSGPADLAGHGHGAPDLRAVVQQGGGWALAIPPRNYFIDETVHRIMMNLSPRVLNTLFVAALFLIIANPAVFGLVDRALGRPILRMRITDNGVPTRIGLVVHAIVFGLLYYFFLAMK
jgi:hypothetical protein